jgi:hypothetical protein
MVELLAHREGHAVPVVQRAASGGEHDSLGPLALGLFSPSVSLHQLELCGPGDNGGNTQREAELHRGNAS